MRCGRLSLGSRAPFTVDSCRALAGVVNQPRCLALERATSDSITHAKALTSWCEPVRVATCVAVLATFYQKYAFFLSTAAMLNTAAFLVLSVDSTFNAIVVCSVLSGIAFGTTWASFPLHLKTYAPEDAAGFVGITFWVYTIKLIYFSFSLYTSPLSLNKHNHIFFLISLKRLNDNIMYNVYKSGKKCGK